MPAFVFGGRACDHSAAALGAISITFAEYTFRVAGFGTRRSPPTTRIRTIWRGSDRCHRAVNILGVCVGLRGF